MAEKTEENLVGKVTVLVVGTLSAGVILAGTYSKVWEYMQPKQYLKQAVVVSVEPYYSRGGDLHWSSKGYRIHIKGEDKPVDFPISNWDGAVKQGDTVDLVVRRSFPWFGKEELDGLSITDNK